MTKDLERRKRFSENVGLPDGWFCRDFWILTFECKVILIWHWLNLLWVIVAVPTKPQHKPDYFVQDKTHGNLISDFSISKSRS